MGTEVTVKPTDSSKERAAALTAAGSAAKAEAKSTVTSAALTALDAASEAILAERNEVEEGDFRQIQFYDAALKAVDTAIREITNAITEAEAAEEA
jgi:hypothetical protein